MGYISFEQYNSNDKNSILRNFKARYKFLANRMVDWYELYRGEIVVLLDGGETIIYDDIDQTFRYAPSDCNNLTEDECRREFGRRLRKIMDIKGFTQNDICDITGISQCQLSNYITGKTSPSFHRVDQIAKALGVSTDEFRYFSK